MLGEGGYPRGYKCWEKGAIPGDINVGRRGLVTVQGLCYMYKGVILTTACMSRAVFFTH